MFIKLFLRLAIGVGFLSAVADRFGMWPATVSAWGNFDSFLAATQTLNPWAPESFIYPLAVGVTIAEVVFGICIIIGFRTALMAKFSGLLLILFTISMTLTGSIKAPLDYGVFGIAAAAFALSAMKQKNFELDNLL